MKRWLIYIALITLLVYNYDKIGRVVFSFPYREIIHQQARAHGIDPYLLVAVIRAESNFDKEAVSVEGARGLMQIMPDTGRWIAGQLGERNFHPDSLFDPETNIRYGSWYLSDLNKEFRGNLVLVLAAYNGGRGNVREWLTRDGLTGLETIDRIPFPETSAFVKKVLLFRQVYAHLYREP